MKSVSVFAPATIANVGCAFDVLGLALEQPGDTVTAAIVDSEGVSLHVEGSSELPVDQERNVAIVSTRAMLHSLKQTQPEVEIPPGLKLTLKKGLPIGSGLGSSSASSAAAVVAVNSLLGEPFTRRELLPFAMEGERIACGSAHADNVAPAILGGVILIRSYSPLDIISLRFPTNLLCVAVTPAIEVKTSDARRVLRREIALSTAVRQWGNIAGLVAGFLQEDLDLIGRSLEDHIIEPERAALIPGFYEVKGAAVQAGALGCSISGAGPTVFAFARDRGTAEAVSRGMQQAFSSKGVTSSAVISAINPDGAKAQG